MKAARLAALAAAVCLAVVPARADEVLDGISQLPAAVEDVRIAGTFASDTESGAYRVIVARSTEGGNIVARLFIQRIVFADDGSARVEGTAEIVELGQLQVDIADASGEVNADGLSLYIETIKLGEPGQLYELFVGKVDDYRFGPASN